MTLLEMPVQINVETILIIILIAFILGMVIGIMLSRPIITR